MVNTDFDFDLPIRTTGRRHTTVCEIVRDVVPEDILLLDQERPQGRVVSKLRERHHALARCLASGMRDTEAAIATGYDPMRISLLKSDPAMAELIRFYRGTITQDFVEREEVWKGISLDALNELRDRLEEKPDDMSDTFLLKLAEAGADRTGLGPSSNQNQNVNVTINMADRMEKARARRLALEGTVLPQPAAAFPAGPVKITDVGD